MRVRGAKNGGRSGALQLGTNAQTARTAADGLQPVLPPIQAIESMDRDALLALWASTLGSDVPSRLSQPFLRRILSFELQARAEGGLPAAVKRKLESLATVHTSGRVRTPTSPKLKAGGRLLREWSGVTHVVDVVEGGFLWRGKRHRSLSAIARAITGAHWSGPRFFGLQEGANKTKAANAAGTKNGTGRNSSKVDALTGKVGDAPALAAEPSRRRTA